MVQATRRSPAAPAAPSTPAPSTSEGAALDLDEKKRPPSPPAGKPGAGRSTKLGRKVESPSSLRAAGPSGQRGRTQETRKHPNK